MIVLCSTAGTERTRLSTRSMKASVRSCEVPGGIVTTPMMVPVSSLGTMAVGVMFISQMSRAMAPPVMPMERKGRWMKPSTAFL